MLDYTILDLCHVEQLQADLEATVGPRGERLLRSEARELQEYIRERIAQVNFVIFFIEKLLSHCVFS